MRVLTEVTKAVFCCLVVLLVVHSTCSEYPQTSHRSKRQSADLIMSDYLARSGLARGGSNPCHGRIACGLVDYIRAGKKRSDRSDSRGKKRSDSSFPFREKDTNDVKIDAGGTIYPDILPEQSYYESGEKVYFR